MSKEGIKQAVEKAPIDPAQYPKATPVTFGVFACWLLAIAFGLAFWTLLFRVTPPIVRLVQRS